MKHDYITNDDGLVYCKTCKGKEGSLPTDCPGQRMSEQQEDAVHKGWTDFKDGVWESSLFTTDSGHTLLKPISVAYEPQEDITVYELAQLLPVLLGHFPITESTLKSLNPSAARHLKRL